MFPVVLDLSIVFSVSWVVVTQVVIPLWKDQKIFPIFRKKSNEIQSEIEEVNSQIQEAEMENNLRKRKQTLKKTRSTN